MSVHSCVFFFILAARVYQFDPSTGPIKADDKLCVFCEFIMSEIKGLITKNSTEVSRSDLEQRFYLIVCV